MRILVKHSELGVLRGGGENFTRNLFTAFAERGHNVKAAFLADHKTRYPIPLPSNIEPIPISGLWSRNFGQGFLSFIRRFIPCEEKPRARWNHVQEALSWRAIRLHDRRFARRVERDFCRIWNQFDVIYVHANPLLASKIARHRPTILRLPGPTTADLAPALRAVHAVCANGDALIRIRRFLGDHAIELPIGVDRHRFSSEGYSIRSDLGWTDQDRVFGYVGRLTHLKGVDLLATAFHEMSCVAPNAKLLVIGRGTEERYMRSVLSKELAGGSVHIEPDVDHEKLAAWYRAMNLLVMPSRYENFSNAMLEAMSCGIPILASNIGGNTILSATGAGWLFEPASMSSLSLQMRRLLEIASEMKTRGKLGSIYVRDCLTWAASAKRLEEIIAFRLGVKA